ncbi:MAG: GNAT family N-acetyltransferase [Thermoplasmata archaeon]|nr:MAG: GNAT family N-acetyltransferase [Thermoplasmata archaeon]
MIIRKFRYEDLESVTMLAYSSLEEGYTPDFFLTLWETSPNGFIIAEEERVVGFILGVLTDIHSLRILMLCVEKAKRRKGVGTALIKALIQNFPRVERVYLEVKVNNKGAIKFYEKLGFRIIDFLPHFYNDGTDGYLMEKRLF